MREVFSDVALVARYAEVEVALAKAEARCGVIPQEAADQIAARTDVTAFDFDLQVLTLQFDRAIDVASFDSSQVAVDSFDGQWTYQGSGPATVLSPTQITGSSPARRAVAPST